MSKRIKSKTVQATIQNRDVLDMFHGVLGTADGGVSPGIAWPKYQLMHKHCERFITTLEIFRNQIRSSSAMSDRFGGEGNLLSNYIEGLRRSVAESFVAPDLSGYVSRLTDQLDPALAPPETIGKFVEVFGKVKKSTVVNTVVITCKNLIDHKASIEKSEALRDRFLKGAGMVLSPIPDLPAINFKRMYNDAGLGEEDRRFILLVIHKLYTIGHELYETISAPDVDVNEFVEVIMASIEDLKRRRIPGLENCGEAFNKIVESVDLLKGNFGEYYRDYVASNNPTVIMENFVLDVSRNTKASARVANQFRKIIGHYRKMASQSSNDPKLRSLFQHVDKNFQELERKSQKAGEAGPDDEPDSGEDDSPQNSSDTSPGPAAAADPGPQKGLAEELDDEDSE